MLWRKARHLLCVQRGDKMNIAIEQPSEADLDIIHAFLTETYWSPGMYRLLGLNPDAQIPDGGGKGER
jgi:hypothetical protein